MAEERVGRVVQVIGPVLDVEFPEGHLPAIYNAIVIKEEASKAGVAIDVIAEVAQHLGENRVRCISMKPTDGMVRGMKAIDTGAPISVPVGPETLGRILNVVGEPVDNLGPVNAKERWSIHREPPRYEDQSTEVEMFETGHQGRGPPRAVLQGGKDGPLRRGRRRQDGHRHGAHQQRRHAAWRLFRLRGGRRAHARGQRPLRRDDANRASSRRATRRSPRPR